MKSFLQFFLIVILLICFNSCQKERDISLNEEQQALSQTINSASNFLDENYTRSINSFICKTPGDTINITAINQIKAQLSNLNTSKPELLNSFEDLFGYPLWDANIYGKGSNENDWFLIPLLVQNEKKTNSVLLAHRLPNENYELNFYKRYDILNHIEKNNTSNIDVVMDMYDLFTMCDCNIFGEVFIDSISFTTNNPTIANRNVFIDVEFFRPGTFDDCGNCDPESMSIPSFVSEFRTVLAGCGGGAGGNSNGGSFNGQGGVFWGGGTGTGGGIDTGGGSSQGGGGGGSNSNPFGLNCVPNFEIASYFELLTELEGFVSRNNVPYSAHDIIEYINPSCLNDLLSFDQCVIDHIRCLGIETGSVLGLSESEIETFILDPINTVLPAVFFLKKENYDLEAKTFINGVIDFIALDSQLKMERFIEVYYLFLDDPDFLVRDCLENQNPNEVDFTDLLNYVPPQNVLARLDDLGEGWRLQPLETPTSSPSLNLDYFSVIIDQMPINPSTGVVWTHDDFFSYMRKNINYFVDNTWAEFNPFSPEDDAIWLSSNPVTAVISIDIFGPDNGSVICAQNQSCCWIFSTVKTPNLPGFDGYHPVSGNRQFGYNILSNGSMEIYVKGVDRFLTAEIIGGSINPAESRTEKLLLYLMEYLAFNAADQLWESFQEGVKSYVEEPTQQGIATVVDPILLRPQISQSIIEALRSANKIEYIPCGN